MRQTAAVIFAISLAASVLAQTPAGSDFSGEWKLNPSRSEIGKLPSPPETYLKIEQSAASVSVLATTGGGSSPSTYLYPLDGRTETRKSATSSLSTQTKWEGGALVTSTLASVDGRNYTVMDYWKLSASGKTLTIRRTIVDSRGESESVLVYESPAAGPAPAMSVATPRPQPRQADESAVVVASGTRILLQLKNGINTKHSAVGDRVYLETSMPVFINQRVAIPAGSYVMGTITESERAPKGHGKAALNIRFDSLTLPNGVTRDFRSRASSAESTGDLNRDEGRITGDNRNGQNAKTVGTTAAGGAAIGTLAGAARNAPLTGLGVGAAAGGAAGLIGVLMTRGPDVILRPGAPVEMVLDRDISFTADEIARWAR